MAEEKLFGLRIETKKEKEIEINGRKVNIKIGKLDHGYYDFLIIDNVGFFAYRHFEGNRDYKFFKREEEIGPLPSLYSPEFSLLRELLDNRVDDSIIAAVVYHYLNELLKAAEKEQEHYQKAIKEEQDPGMKKIYEEHIEEDEKIKELIREMMEKIGKAEIKNYEYAGYIRFILERYGISEIIYKIRRILSRIDDKQEDYYKKLKEEHIFRLIENLTALEVGSFKINYEYKDIIRMYEERKMYYYISDIEKDIEIDENSLLTSNIKMKFGDINVVIELYYQRKEREEYNEDSFMSMNPFEPDTYTVITPYGGKYYEILHEYEGRINNYYKIRMHYLEELLEKANKQN